MDNDYPASFIMNQSKNIWIDLLNVEFQGSVKNDSPCNVEYEEKIEKALSEWRTNLLFTEIMFSGVDKDAYLLPVFKSRRWNEDGSHKYSVAMSASEVISQMIRSLNKALENLAEYAGIDYDEIYAEIDSAFDECFPEEEDGDE